MLNILELWVKSRGWCYGRLDGNTPVGTRQSLIDRFNTDDSVFVMLLTTRTGGVGTNLTGTLHCIHRVVVSKAAVITATS
jgi:DNA excision repair protein ERCC-6